MVSPLTVDAVLWLPTSYPRANPIERAFGSLNFLKKPRMSKMCGTAPQRPSRAWAFSL